MYRARAADLLDDDDIEHLRDLHKLTFADTAPLPELNYGHWWLMYPRGEEVPVAFCGVVPSSMGQGYAYLKRAGVIHAHRGKRLQLRMIRLRERTARLNGWHTIVTETTDNPASANTLIKAGYRIFNPDFPWGLPTAIYWRKVL